MVRCDVLIVGGGPAGSTCARRLVAAGLEVVVVDRRTFPRDKTCAGWVTPPVLDELGFDADDYRRSRVFQPILGFRTGVIGGEEVATDYGRPVSYGIRRFEFDHYLLERCGARMRLGENLTSLERADATWIVNGTIEARMLVGAGGHFCPIARRLGNRESSVQSVVAAQEIEFEVPPGQLDRVHVRPDVPELFFCPDLKGYGWCFRKGNWLNIGLGRVNSDGIASDVRAFVRFLSDRGKVGCDIPERFHGHAYRLYERTWPRLVDDGVLLVGDSAGLAYPQSGEGIRPAVESAIFAADVIRDCDGDYRRERLAAYADQVERRFGRPRPDGAADWLPAAFLQGLARRLLGTKWFTRNVVLDRWFLHADEPAIPTESA